MSENYVKKTYKIKIGRFAALIVGIVACSFMGGFFFVREDWLAFAVSVLCVVQFVFLFFIDLNSCEVVWRSWNYGVPDVSEGMKVTESWF